MRSWKEHLHHFRKHGSPCVLEFWGVLAVLMGETGVMSCCLFILELILSFPNLLCLFSLSDRNSRFKTKEDCGNSDSNVLHPWNHNSPWNCLLYPQLARDPASHYAAQLSLPPLLLVMWFWSLSYLHLPQGHVESRPTQKCQQQGHWPATPEWLWAF